MATKKPTYAELTPSVFCIHPFDSVLQKTEAEVVARNIMVILKRTGNKFRELSWDEYQTERLKDGQYSSMEKGYFDRVIKYCEGPEMAMTFADVWCDAAREATGKAKK